MPTYQEQQAKKRYFILLKNGQFVGLFGNLKRLAEYGLKEFGDLSSYSKLSKIKTYPIVDGKYVIEKAKVIK